MAIVLLPLVGPFHRRFPRFNAVTVLESVQLVRPTTVLTTAVTEKDLRGESWRELDEPALDLAITWATRAGKAVAGVGEPSPDPQAQEDFGRYLEESGLALPEVQEVLAHEATLSSLLGQALDARRIQLELLPTLRSLHAARQAAFGEGPGTDWLGERTQVMADRIEVHEAADTVVLAPVDHLPALERALEERDVAWSYGDDVPPSEAARERALLDVALAGQSDDPASLLDALARVKTPEARLAEAEVFLRAGDVEAALTTLREASKLDFVEPAWLPGWLLARLGQLADVAGARDEARRAYRGVLALSWVPAVARETAEAGLEQPFQFPGAESEDL